LIDGQKAKEYGCNYHATITNISYTAVHYHILSREHKDHTSPTVLEEAVLEIKILSLMVTI
jgi:hypothetical protein